MVNDTILVNGKPLEDWLEDSKPVRPTEPRHDSKYSVSDYFDSLEWIAYIQAMREYHAVQGDEKLFS